MRMVYVVVDVYRCDLGIGVASSSNSAYNCIHTFTGLGQREL